MSTDTLVQSITDVRQQEYIGRGQNEVGREGGLKIWRKFESMDRGEHRYRGVERKCRGRGMYVYGRRRGGGGQWADYVAMKENTINGRKGGVGEREAQGGGGAYRTGCSRGI